MAALAAIAAALILVYRRRRRLRRRQAAQLLADAEACRQDSQNSGSDSPNIKRLINGHHSPLAVSKHLSDQVQDR